MDMLRDDLRSADSRAKRAIYQVVWGFLSVKTDEDLFFEVTVEQA